MHAIMLIVSLTLTPGEPAPVDVPFAAIDEHALNAPPEAEQSLDTLAKYLIEPAKNEREKARAIFRWVTDRISFDMEAYMTEHHGQTRPELVLRTRKAVCFGYAALFEALAVRAGLSAVTILGHAKDIGFFDETVDPPQARYRVNHAWNAVGIDGRWQLIDTTRGAGYVRLRLFRKAFQEQFFLMPPNQLVRTHLPSDPRWQLLATPLTHAQFEALPSFDASYLRMGLKSALAAGQPTNPGLHTSFDLYAKHGWMKVLAAPPNIAPLPPGRSYYFLVDAPTAAEVAISQEKQSFPLKKVGTRFEGSFNPRPGPLHLSMRRHPEAPFEAVVNYQVADYPGPATPPPSRSSPWRNLLKWRR